MNSRGFTLLEVLIAMVILAFGLLAILAMQFFTIHSNSLGTQLTEAAVIVDSHLSDFQKLPFTDSSLVSGAHPSTSTTGTTGITYNTSWIVTDFDLNSDTIVDYKFIDTTFTWLDSSGRQKTYRFSATKCNPSLAASYATKGVYFYVCNF